MDKIIERLSAYNIFTNLFPGVIYCFLVDSFLSISLIQEDWLIGLFVYYFIGMVISRTGSLIVEPILEATNFVRYAEYSDYIAASAQDELLPTLLETNNSYRSVLSLLFCIAVTGLWALLSTKFPVFAYYSPYTIVLILTVLFLFSYRKQTRYIVSRVNHHKNQKDNPTG